MNKKTNIILFIILLVLAGAYGFKLYSNQQKIAHQEENKDFFANINLDEINHITLDTKIFGHQDMVKDFDGWKVYSNKNFPVNPMIMDQFLASLNVTKISSIVTDKADNLADYDLTEDLATRISLYAGDDKLAEFALGKQGSLYNSRYVLIPESHEVFLLTGIYIPPMTEDWQNRVILDVPADQINSLKYEYPEQEPFELIKKDDQWYLGDEPADLEKISMATNVLSALTASSVPSQDQDIGPIQLSLTINYSDNEQLTLNFGNEKEEEQLFFVQNDQGNIYFVYSKVKNIFFTQNDF